MFAKYVYKPTSVTSRTQAQIQADILADVLAIATGETNTANLSASCDTVNSVITSTIAAGWVLHDASAGTNAKTIKAPLADDASTYKYLVLNTNTNGSFYTYLYETWDATAHSGTNQASTSANYPQQFSTTAGGTLYLNITARMFMMHSQYSSTWGASSYAGGSAVLERSRDMPWDTVAAGIPPYVYATLGTVPYNDAGFSAPRKQVRTSGTPVTGASAIFNCAVMPFGSISTAYANMNSADQKVQASGGQGSAGTLLPAWPLLVIDYTVMPMQYGNISSICDVWALPQSSAANLDTVVIGGNNYIVYQEYNTTRLIAVRQG